LDYSLAAQVRQRSQIGSREEAGFRFLAAAPMELVTVSQSPEREGKGRTRTSSECEVLSSATAGGE